MTTVCFYHARVLHPRFCHLCTRNISWPSGQAKKAQCCSKWSSLKNKPGSVRATVWKLREQLFFLVFGHLEFEVEPEMCVTNCRRFPVVTHLIQIKESLSGFQQSLMTSWWSESGVSEQGDTNNWQDRGTRNWIEKYYTRLIVKNECINKGLHFSLITYCNVICSC